MDNLNYDLDNYSQNDLCDMFDIKIDELNKVTEINQKYLLYCFQKLVFH